MQLQAKIKGDFLRQIKDRAAKWKSIPDKVAARIVVPPELSWWYVHEVGVPHGYPIPAHAASKIAYPSSGGQVMADSVNHPGLKARHIVGSVLPDIQQIDRQSLRAFLAAGGVDKPEGLYPAIFAATEEARLKILKSIEVNLPSPPRPIPDQRFADTQSGKLHGKTAAEVYDALAKVINTSR